jgi:malonate transporter and related proteins
MAELLSITVPIFLLIALGFAAVRGKLVPAELVPALGFFVLNLALPALVLHALLAQDLSQTFNWNYIFAYAGGSLLIFGVMFALFQSVLKRSMAHAAIAALGSVASNSGFVGFPVATLAVGVAALTALPLSMLVENVLVIPLALALAEMGSQRGQTLGAALRQTSLRLMRMPLLVAIVLGIVLSALGVHLPAVLDTAIGMVADASAACALFVVGGTLAGVKAASLDGDLIWIAIGKLVLHPLAVWAGFVMLGGVPEDLMAAGIILASAPMITVYAIFGQRFGLGGLAAAALVAATAAGFITMTIVLGLLATKPDVAALTGLRGPHQTVYSDEPFRADHDKNGA